MVDRSLGTAAEHRGTLVPPPDEPAAAQAQQQPAGGRAVQAAVLRGQVAQPQHELKVVHLPVTIWTTMTRATTMISATTAMMMSMMMISAMMTTMMAETFKLITGS